MYGLELEYEALNEVFATRGKRLDEQVELPRALWKEPVIDYDGHYHRVERVGILPLSPAPIPICFGGFSPPDIRRAARMGFPVRPLLEPDAGAVRAAPRGA